jgi:hypothetical protein
VGIRFSGWFNCVYFTGLDVLDAQNDAIE